MTRRKEEQSQFVKEDDLPRKRFCPLPRVGQDNRPDEARAGGGQAEKKEEQIRLRKKSERWMRKSLTRNSRWFTGIWGGKRKEIWLGKTSRRWGGQLNAHLADSRFWSSLCPGASRLSGKRPGKEEWNFDGCANRRRTGYLFAE